MSSAELLPAGMTVDVYDGTYARRGRIGNYTSCAPTWQHLGVGTATIVVDEGGPNPLPAAQLQRNQTEVVPVVINDQGRLWTGRVAHCETDGPPGRGTVTVTLIDDWAWLRAMLAWPVPTAALDAQNPAHDRRTGPIDTVAKAYLQAAITRLGLPMAVVPAPAVDDSPVVDFNPGARFTPLDELLVPQLRATGRRLTAQLWLPGWEQPDGLNLGTPTVILDVTAIPRARHVRWTDDNGILSRRIATTSPTATDAVVGMKNTVTDDPLTRLFTSTTAADGRLAALGPFAFREVFVNATDLGTAADGQARGQEHLAETAGTAAVSIDVLDGAPWTFGRDYDVGSRVRAVTSGVSIADTVERVTVTDNRTDGRIVTPQIGPTSATESPDVLVLQQVAAITAAITAMHTQR